MTVYAVIGSRGFNDYALLKKELDKLKITKIISGGAKGADTLALRYAKENKIPIIEFKPEYEKYGIKAPLVRNKTIIEKSEAVITFWDGKSRGTAYTINYAKKNNKQVNIIRVS